MKRIQAATMMLFTSCAATTSAFADSTDLTAFNCGQHNITIGMSPSDIKQNCSQQPAFVNLSKRPALKQPADGTLKQDVFEKWMYSSAGQPATHVLIKNDKVIRIFTNTTRTAANP